jgi:hypothetical protein
MAARANMLIVSIMVFTVTVVIIQKPLREFPDSSCKLKPFLRTRNA